LASAIIARWPAVVKGLSPSGSVRTIRTSDAGFFATLEEHATGGPPSFTTPAMLAGVN
jgi:hypothetical protein